MNNHELYLAARYQCITPKITTMGPCSNPGCKHAARGSSECKHCLAKKLNALLGGQLGSKLVNTLVQAQHAIWAVEEALEELEEGN